MSLISFGECPFHDEDADVGSEPMGPFFATVPRMRFGLPSVLVLLSAPSLVLAGDFHTRDYSATVRAVKRVKTYAFVDRLATFTDDKAAVQRGGPACEIRLSVHDAFFKKQQVVFASEQACESVKPAATVAVQYLGLGPHAQFVSLRLGGVWHSLPVMRQTAATFPPILACLEGGRDGGSERSCSPSSGPPL